MPEEDSAVRRLASSAPDGVGAPSANSFCTCKNGLFGRADRRKKDAQYSTLAFSCAEKNFIVYFGAALLIKLAHNNKPLEGIQMKWETPAYNDMRFGFEVTMYIYNR